jgi:hypothetical protein
VLGVIIAWLILATLLTKQYMLCPQHSSTIKVEKLNNLL